MGNKRKASLIIVSVFVAAIAVFAGAYDLLKRFNVSDPKKSGASAESMTISNGYGIIEGTTNNCQMSNSIPTSSGTYMIIFAGQDGAGSYAGNGAECLAFCKNSSMSNQFIGFDGGSGSYYGGGYTDAYSNFAIPSGSSVGYARAAGGGGGGTKESYCNNAHAVFKSYGNQYNAQFNYAGRSATQEKDGANPFGSSGIDATTRYVGPYGSKPEPPSYDAYTSSGGGGGYHNGSAGGYYSTASNSSYYNYIFQGGGGACSPNCYPVYSIDSVNGSKSTGNGYIKVYRIDPINVPSSNSATSDNLTGSVTLKTASRGPGSGRYDPSNVLSKIKAAWVYKKTNGSWTTDANDVARTTPGSTSVECRYVLYASGDTDKIGETYRMQYTSATSAATSDYYTIYSCTVNITLYCKTSVASAPTGASLAFNNQDQSLLSKVGTANSYGSMRYSLDKVNWVNDDNFKNLKGKEPGNYTIYYRAVSTDSYVSDGDIKSMTVTIGAGDATLDPGTLAGRRLIYNGGQLQLYDGDAKVIAPDNRIGTVYYGYSLTLNNPSVKNETTIITDLKARDACDGNGNQYTYYLFYRMSGTKWYNTINWTYSNVSVQIAKATYDFIIDKNNDVPYDGQGHSIYDGSAIIKSDSGALNDWVEVNYNLKYTGNNGVVVESLATDDPSKLNLAQHAGKYELSATITPRVDYRNQINYNTVTHTYNILKSKNRDLAKMTGLTYNSTSAYELDETASSYPFRFDDVEQKLDLTVANVDTYNGLSTHNDNNYNTIGYLLTRVNGEPNDETVNEIGGGEIEDAIGFIECSAYTLNETITNLAVHKSGIWFLWLKVVSHNSLEDSVKIWAAQFTVNGFNDAMVKLQGLTMTGADAVSKDGKIDYDGLSHPVVKSGTAVRPIDSQAALDLRDLEYAVSTFSNYAERHKLEWKPTPNDETFFAKNVNTYYLWVRWGASDNLQGTAGVIYAHFEIQQLVANSARFYFDAVRVNIVHPDFPDDPHFIWKLPDELNNNMMIYSTTYNNAEQYIGTLSNLYYIDDTEYRIKAYLLDNAIKNKDENPNLVPMGDLTAYGDFSIGVSTDISTMNGVYYPAEEFSSKVTVKDVNNYYLWIRWGGSANITAGETVIRQLNGTSGLKPNSDPRITPCFQVKQLTDNSSTELDFEVIDLADTKEHKYLYEFLSTGTTANLSGRYEGVAQALFSADKTPSITINGNLYSEPSVSYKYMLTTAAADIAPSTGKLDNNSGWVNSIDQAAMTDVAQYYLWLLVTIDDNNVKLQKTFRVENGDGKIVPTESFVRIEPTAIAAMWTGERLDVVRKSGQIAPEVEYAMFKYDPENETEVQLNDLSADEIAADSDKVYTENGWKWTKDVTVNAMRPIDAGLYKVYFRGAQYGNMFVTQSPAEDGYSYILVEVGQTTAHISAAGMPKALNVTYTGKRIDTFSDGFAQTPNYKVKDNGEVEGKSGIPLLYSWDNKNFYPYDKLEKQIDAGVYLLYFMPDTSDPDLQNDVVDVLTMTVKIAKAPIRVNTPWTMEGSNLIYKADGYHLFIDAVDYAMVDTAQNEPLMDESGTNLTYSNNQGGVHGGKMGMIYYALSTGPTIYPTTGDWKTNYNEVVAQQTGSYYIWMKVDEGDNHLFQAATCYNKNSPITIIAAQQYVNEDGAKREIVRLSKSSYEAVRNGDNSYLRYDGLSKNLLKNFNLQIEVANRNDNGELDIVDDQIKYNLMPTGDRLGRVYYALKSRPDAFPSLNDFSQDGWQTSWQVLNKTDAGTYYLLVMIVFDADSNIGQIQFCLTTLETQDGSERNELRILPAVHGMISVSGISGITQMYNNGPQKIAAGRLTVTIKDSRYDITDQVEVDEYCYVNVINNSGMVPTIDSAWTPFDETMAKSVGKYQLYVYLKVVSDNIDSDTEPLIFPLFFNPITLETDDLNYYAEITRADANNVTIVAPSLAQGLIYNGQDQCLIWGPAKVEMKNKTYGAELEGGTGKTYYYISSSKDTITGDKTSHGGVKDSDYSLDGLLKEKHVGTYYIWVEFDEGVSYVAMDPICIGSVTIAQATDLNIALSGVGFTKNTYNGELYTVFTDQVQQTFIDGGAPVDRADIFEIEYAYSSDPRTVPSDNTLWKTESDLLNLKARDAGKYYVWIRVTGQANEFGTYNNIANYMKCYCINEDADYSEIFRANMNNSYIQGVVPHTGLVYIGRNQTLASIADGDKLKIVMTDQDLYTDEFNRDLDIRWALGSGIDETNPDNVPAETDFRINLADVSAKNHGEYYLWVWVQECKNFNEYKACFKVINIDKGTIHFTLQPEANDLVYLGADQELFNTPATIKFYAVGDFYDPETPYYAADEVTVEYAIISRGAEDVNNEAIVWTSDYQAIQGFHAVKYKVQCRVLDTDNWNAAYDDTTGEIKSADASTLGVGLAEKPHELTDLVYNEEEQDLIDFGSLVAFENGYGSALEGAKIVFNYKDLNTKYSYYYENGRYVWGNTGKLPGRINAGDYHIQYYVTGTDNGNYHDSAVYDLYITISKRSVYWINTPQPISGLKYTGAEQPALTPGQLNVGETNPCTAKGVKVLYSTYDQGSVSRHWKETIPEIKDIGLTFIWYYVWVDDNNQFVDEVTGADNSQLLGTRLVVSLERYILSIRDHPRTQTLMYTAKEQDLIIGASLSTDGIETFGEENTPYFEYRLDGTTEWKRMVTAKAVKKDPYKIYYRVHYNPDIFRFEGNDGQEKPMEVNVIIDGTHIETDSVRAVYDATTGTISYDATKQVLNEATGEMEWVPSYSDTFMDEFSHYIHYWYRLYDEYNPDTKWKAWEDGGAEIRDTLGTYQFKLTIDESPNCYYYSQFGTQIPYATYTAKHDRVVQIIMPEKSFTTPAYVRAWIDFTGNMLYDEAKFQFQGQVGSDGRLNITFEDVDSIGVNRKGVIRVQTLNAKYYHISDAELSKDEKVQKTLGPSTVNAIKTVNVGLSKASAPVYIYEIYRIEYAKNAGIGDLPAAGWKWHGIDYQLGENNLVKTEKGVVLTPDGWNTTKAGNGNNYSNGFLYYRENASQRFYAHYLKPSERYYTIEWIIRKDTPNGTLKYTLSRDSGVWFNVAQYQSTKRNTGMLIAEGDVIVLPQVTEDEDHNLLADIFGGYVMRWHAENEDLEYRVGMTAGRNITFVAELSDDVDDWVECVFYDDQDNIIHSSGKVANGAEAYMALSGMDSITIKNYNNGFDQWVDNHQTAWLDRAYANEDNTITYNLGTKIVIEEPTVDNGKVALGDYIAMIVILILGAASTVASLTVYIIMYKKRHPAASKNLKENTNGQLAV